MRLDVHPADLPSVVRNAIDVIAPTIEAKGVRIETQVDPRPEELQPAPGNFSGEVGVVRKVGHVQVDPALTGISRKLRVRDTDFSKQAFERVRTASHHRNLGQIALGAVSGQSRRRHFPEAARGRLRWPSTRIGRSRRTSRLRASFRVRLPTINKPGGFSRPSSPSCDPRLRYVRVAD